MEVFFTNHLFDSRIPAPNKDHAPKIVTSSMPFIVNDDGSIHEDASDWTISNIIRGKDPKTVKDYAYRVNDYLNWCLANSINYLDVDGDVIARFLYDKRRGDSYCKVKPVGNNTSNHINTAIRSFYKRLQLCGRVTEVPNPKDITIHAAPNEGAYAYLGDGTTQSSGLQVPIIKKVPKWKPLADLAQFISQCTPRSLRLMASLMLETGLRREEAAHLNIEIIRRTPKVPDNHPFMVKVWIEADITPTKNSKSRPILISPYLLNSLKDYIAHDRLYVIKRGKLNQCDAGIVVNGKVPTFNTLFLTNRGSAYALDSVNAMFARVSNAAGIKPEQGKVRPHLLRHSFAKALKNLGWTPANVARLLGHGSAITTELIYWHFSDEDIREDIRWVQSGITQMLIAVERGSDNLESILQGAAFEA